MLIREILYVKVLVRVSKNGWGCQREEGIGMCSWVEKFLDHPSFLHNDQHSNTQ
jgi:hypothetical protein